MSTLPESLSTGDTHARVAALQELALTGEPGVVVGLLKIAREDKSPGVRLGAASAAVDILSRYRVGEKAASFDKWARLAVLDAFKGIDPGVSPPVMAVLGSLGIPKGLDRLLVGLRDPRYDVRNGAAVGLMRFAISAAVAGDEAAPEKVIQALGDPRYRSDALVGMMRVCLSAGWAQAERAMLQHLDRKDQAGEFAKEAIARFEQAAADEFLIGAWRSDGLDAGEVDPTPRVGAWLILVGELGLYGVDGDLAPIRWRIEDGVLVVRLGNDRVDWQPRRMWRFLGGDEPERGLQLEGRTFAPATPEDLIALADDLADGGGGVDRRRRQEVADLIAGLLPDTVAARQSLAVLQLSVGRHEDALARLEALIASRKKPPAFLYFHLGEALAAVGRQADARKAWATYLDGASKKAPFVNRAKARLS